LLAHIHPATAPFCCLLVPTLPRTASQLCVWSPLEVIGTTECPEPLCLGWALPTNQGDSKVTSEGVTPLSQLLRAHASDHGPPHTSVIPWCGVCAGCRESLLDHGPSRHYLCHLCGGAWTHTPPCSSGAYAHFFPNDSGLTSRETRLAHGKTPARRLPQGAQFRGCSHSLMFRLPHLLGLQIAPTAVHRRGGQAVYTTHRPRGYPPRDVVSLHV
jgi:hypothetical protein